MGKGQESVAGALEELLVPLEKSVVPARLEKRHLTLPLLQIWPWPPGVEHPTLRRV